MQCWHQQLVLKQLCSPNRGHPNACTTDCRKTWMQHLWHYPQVSHLHLVARKSTYEQKQETPKISCRTGAAIGSSRHPSIQKTLNIASFKGSENIFSPSVLYKFEQSSSHWFEEAMTQLGKGDVTNFYKPIRI